MALSRSHSSVFESIKNKGNRDLGCQNPQNFLACGAASSPLSWGLAVAPKKCLFSTPHQSANVLGARPDMQRDFCEAGDDTYLGRLGLWDSVANTRAPIQPLQLDVQATRSVTAVAV